MYSELLLPLGIGTHIPFRKLLPFIVHVDCGVFAWAPQKTEPEGNSLCATPLLGCAVSGISRKGRGANIRMYYQAVLQEAI